MTPLFPLHRAFAIVLLAAACAVQAFAAPEPGVQWIAMTDGTRLAADVHLPEGGGPWPVILARSTYGRKAISPAEFTERGYALVIQDVRGMGESEGEPYVFHADGWREGLADGADTVAWIQAQEWCNGKIGTFGGSALAITQMLLAPATDGVAAQYMDAVPANFYQDVTYTGGVFRKNMIEGWLRMIQQPHLIPIYRSEPRYGAFWSYYNAVAQADRISAPGLFVNGWYDIFAQGTIDGFVSRQESGAPGARGKNILIMKWSSHGPDTTPAYTFNENRFDLRVSRIRNAFFDHHLKGDEAALADIPSVHYYVMGADTPGAPGNEWRTAGTWPPFDAAETPYYLHADGSLAVNPPEAAAAALHFDFDPANPYPTHGGANLIPPLVSGPYDQRDRSKDRDDYLQFATAPLDAPLEVTGRVRVLLHVSSDAPDTDFTAKLLDIYPEGDARELNVMEGIRRVKYRDGFETAAPLLEGPDQVVQLEIDLWSTSWIFNAGHRIGLQISSSNYPRFEVNPNTGADFPEKGGEMRRARNTVHLDSVRPSALILPLRPDS